MTLLLAGIVLFFAVHLVRVAAPGFRQRAMGRVGAVPWKGVYALLSIAGFALILIGYPEAKSVSGQAWVPPVWGRHVAVAMMVPVLILLPASYLRGAIRSRVKHPLLIATVLWSGAHLLANGAWADVLLFGSFLAWSALVLASAWRRPPAARDTPALPATPANDAIAVLIGVSAWIWLMNGGHTWLVGLPPMY